MSQRTNRVNTLKWVIWSLPVQRVLSDPPWSKRRLTTEDLRALTPLIYGHVNPYGIFRLDMNARLPIDSIDVPGA